MKRYNKRYQAFEIFRYNKVWRFHAWLKWSTQVEDIFLGDFWHSFNILSFEPFVLCFVFSIHLDSCHGQTYNLGFQHPNVHITHWKQNASLTIAFAFCVDPSSTLKLSSHHGTTVYLSDNSWFLLSIWLMVRFQQTRFFSRAEDDFYCGNNICYSHFAPKAWLTLR